MVINLSTYIFALILLSFFFYKYYKSNNKIYLILFSGFILRLVFIIFDINFDLFPYEWDTDIFTYFAREIQVNILNSNLPYENINESFHILTYSTIQAIISIITNNSEVNMRIFNSFLGAFSGIYIYKMSSIIFKNKNNAILSTIIFLIWPSFILYTSINMREALIIYLTLYILYHAYYFKFKFNKYNLITAFYLMLLILLKIPNLIFFAVIIIIFLIIKKMVKGKIKWYYASVILIIFILSGLFIIQIGIVPEFGIEQINSQMLERTRGGSQYLVGMEYQNSFDILKYLPIRLIHFLFGPFINNIDNIFMIGAFIDGTLILLMFIYYLYYFFKNKLFYNNYELFLILYVIIGAAGNAVFDANYGTSLRHRMLYIMILFIYISPIIKRGYDYVTNHFNHNKK